MQNTAYFDPKHAVPRNILTEDKTKYAHITICSVERCIQFTPLSNAPTPCHPAIQASLSAGAAIACKYLVCLGFFFETAQLHCRRFSFTALARERPSLVECEARYGVAIAPFCFTQSKLFTGN